MLVEFLDVIGAWTKNWVSTCWTTGLPGIATVLKKSWEISLPGITKDAPTAGCAPGMTPVPRAPHCAGRAASARSGTAMVGMPCFW